MTSELLSRDIKESPKAAIKELIWNSCDADSTLIEIKLTFNKFEGLESVLVADNGHGINYEDLDELFGAYGFSNKTYGKKSPNGRVYHGKLGQGRYQSFCIGNEIEWKSTYSADDGKKYEFYIYFTDTDKMRVEYSDKSVVSNDKECGVEVTIKNIDSGNKTGELLDHTLMETELVSSFAPYLLAYSNIKVIYHGVPLNIEKHIQETVEKEVEYEQEEGQNEDQVKADIKLISWKQKTPPKKYICGENGTVIDEEPLQKSKNHPISMYLMSSYYDQMKLDGKVNLGNLDPVYAFFEDKSASILEDFIGGKNDELAAEEMKKIRNGKAYPYVGDPIDEVEVVERQVFDMLALEINKVVPEFKKSNAPTKKLTYRLIKEAVKTNPDSLSKILTEVFDLSQEEQDDLARLLDYTTLPSIINTSKIISDRLLFINALEQMVYTEIGKKIKERVHFHKILLHELWVFGEKYNLGASDISLKNVLKAYLFHLEREKLVPEIDVKASEDMSLIPDLMLWNQYPIQDEQYENLVIELKRPTKKLTSKELQQIKSYAFAIAKDDRFPKENTKWTFFLLGQTFDDYVTQELKDKKNGRGNFYNSDDGQISISVLKWNTLIHQNKMKYQFLKEKLNYSIDSNEKSLEYLKEKYSEFLPEE